ncbi:1-deoxy-D-xylulose-5-phosphate reductoisomerase [Helicobacter jaachi]|uniref:1-deoxy-D-xylulose 5-phosphate reductoisomerase n=1 Tax=Helicobacter jaachi TaxID=1677920 RepID=A0A4U8TAJ2_9HELI|nr:1-deoxy-D-xylulose-5-phosphate reductoisomerase [Helicobacter jaachi]TLD96900.1 1-deoxy-D-xylulose-5-phosphate reductoisomerase [Helicobacter jaachi]
MILLGSTGSIGTNALAIAQQFGIDIESVCAGKNIALLNEQIKVFKPKNVCIAHKEDSHKLISGDYRLFYGERGILDMIESSHSHLVVNALVGFMGLAPSFKALKCAKRLALANKESLVNAGWLLSQADIIPIDSEHFGLWYLKSRPFKKLYITASGGAFRDMPLKLMAKATPQDALKHPNWQMGQKITIDSATMVNKLFEILEARWLFDSKDIDAFIESSSQMHALIEFFDGSITAHISTPDMKLPIAYALDASKASMQSYIKPFDISALSVCLKPISSERYPLWILKNELLACPQKGIVLNASNEVAVEAFLAHKIPFMDISALVLDMIEHFAHIKLAHLNDIESIQDCDAQVRALSKQWIERRANARL